MHESPAKVVVGWTRAGGEGLRYAIATRDLLERAGVAARAVPSGEDPPGRGARRDVPVPDVAGLTLVVAFETEARLRHPHPAPDFAGSDARDGFWRGRHPPGSQGARRERSRARRRFWRVSPTSCARRSARSESSVRPSPKAAAILVSTAVVARESERLDALVERVLASTRLDQRPRFARRRPEEPIDSALALIAPRASRRGSRWSSASPAPCRGAAGRRRRPSRGRRPSRQRRAARAGRWPCGGECGRRRRRASAQRIRRWSRHQPA